VSDASRTFFTRHRRARPRVQSDRFRARSFAERGAGTRAERGGEEEEEEEEEGGALSREPENGNGGGEGGGEGEKGEEEN